MRNRLARGKRLALLCTGILLATRGLLPQTIAPHQTQALNGKTPLRHAEDSPTWINHPDAESPWDDHELPAAKPDEMPAWWKAIHLQDAKSQPAEAQFEPHADSRKDAERPDEMPEWWRAIHLQNVKSQPANAQFELHTDLWKDAATQTAAMAPTHLLAMNGAPQIGGAGVQSGQALTPEQKPASPNISSPDVRRPNASPGADIYPTRETLGEYVLGPADQIVIHAADVPDISDKPLSIDPNGDITMPMVGRIHAEGLTSQQLEEELTKRLKIYILAPDVAVNVAEFRSQPISVLGEVNTSGVQQLQGRKTLLEVLSMAGGVRPDAGPSIRITRRREFGRIPLPGAANDSTGEFSFAEVDLKSLVDGKSPEKNILIRPYDVISVPRAEVIFVVGEVGKSGPLPLDGHTMSVLTAVSSSGGVLRTAAPDRAMILRPIMGGPKRAELPVDLKKIMKGQANDVPLLAGDIVFVPDSAGKRAASRAAEAVLQMGTLIGSYAIIH